MTFGRISLFLAMLPAAPFAHPVLAQSAPAEPGANPSDSVTLPIGTPLAVSLPTHLPMRAGEPIRAELLYPVYAGDRLVLPAHTTVTGAVVALTPDHHQRVESRLQADFTPFDIPIVRFDHILLADGTSIPISTGAAADGAPIYRLLAPPPRPDGFLAQHLSDARQSASDALRVVTDPGKADRMQQLIYSQLPYHPQRIAKDTAWTVETDAPVSFKPVASPPLAAAQPVSAMDAAAATAATPASSDPATWIVQGYLITPISSATSKPGDVVSATVAEPVFNPDGSIAVPQGAILSGTVTQARPARRFARAGQLRFTFRELTLPGGEPEAVRASLRGLDSAHANQLAMDSEGNVNTKSQDKVIIPLILLTLASRPLDHDDHDQFIKDALASNCLGFVGFILGTAARLPNLAAGIGYFGAAVSIYDRIFGRGKEVAFARDTRVIIQTTASRAPVLKAGSQPSAR